MDKVFFRPWIGDAYGTGDSLFKLKVLILGDSHYCEEECTNCGHESNKARCGNFTTEVISDYLNPDLIANWKRTFSKFMNSFVNDTPKGNLDREKLWNSVAFYNYLQIAAGNDSRQAHLYDFKTDSHRNALTQVVYNLEPDVIICWGNNVWDALPDDFGWGSGNNSGKFDGCHYVYNVKGKTHHLIGINHPSTSYKSSYFNHVFTELKVNG